MINFANGFVDLFLRDIPEQAEVYTDYDKFTAETMKLQKDLKDDLVKVPK